MNYFTVDLTELINYIFMFPFSLLLYLRITTAEQ